MADVQIKVDILPEITKAAIQEAVNAAASGLKLNIGSVQLGGVDTSQLTRDVQTLLQKAFQNPKSPPKITPEFDFRSAQSSTKKLVSNLSPLEAKLKRLVANGLDPSQANKFRSSITGITGDVKKLSGATGQEFKRMQNSINSEMKKLSDGMEKSEQKMRQQMMKSGMRSVNSRYNSLTSKMDKTGVSGRRAELDASYQNAKAAVEREVAAKMSGDAAAVTAASNAAKEAVASFHTLGRTIDESFNSYNNLKKTLSSLETQKSMLAADPNADISKIQELESELTRLRSILSNMGAASGGEFERMRVEAEGTARSAGDMADNLKRGLKDITTDLRPVINMLDQIQKLEQSNPNLAGTEVGGRVTKLKNELQEILKLGQSTKTRNKELEQELGGTISYAKENGYKVDGGDKSTSKIAALFKNVTGGMIAYEAFYKAKEAARAMYESVVSVDDAMTQLKIVTGASGNEMKTFFQEASASATEFGHSVSEVLGSIETFSRLGYNLNDALNLSNAATVMSNVAAVGVDQSTTGLTSIIKGYGLGADQSMEVADKLTLVGKNWAVSAGELMEALERGGSSLASANNSLDESVALIAAGN